MSFIIKEIYDYYSAKASDGFYIYKLRNLFQQTKILKIELEKENSKNNPINDTINVTNSNYLAQPQGQKVLENQDKIEINHS